MIGLWVVFSLLIGLDVGVGRIITLPPLDWLHDNSCALPCWNGITPGVTSFGEAMHVIQNLPNVAQDTIVGSSADRATWLTFVLNVGENRISVELDGETSAR